VSDSDTESTVSTAYYIDDAVSGVYYECGDQSGTTDEDGAFTFVVGDTCTFYLGTTIALKEFSTAGMTSGESIFETDIETAQILQSLNSGSVDGVITIDDALVAALVEAGITTVIEEEVGDEDDVADLFATIEDAVEGAGGTFVSEDDAENHLISSMLEGSALIAVGRDEDGDPVYHSFEYSLTDDGEVVNWTSQLVSDNGTESVELDGDTLTFYGDVEDCENVLSLVTNDEDDSYYIKMVDDDGLIEHLYLETADAESYLVEVMLAGNTLYAVTGTFVETWTFAADLASSAWDDGDETGEEILTYADLVMTATDEDGTTIITFTEITSAYIAIETSSTTYGNSSGRLYFAADDADAYAATFEDDAGGDDTSTATPITLTYDDVIGQTWYVSDFTKVEFGDNGDYVYFTNQVNYDDEDGTVATDYEIVDGELVVDSSTTITLYEGGDNYYNAELYSTEWGEEELVFYTTKAAFEDTLREACGNATLTVSDDTDDSLAADYTTDHAGFELTAVSATLDGDYLTITVTAEGAILAALEAGGDTHNLWFSIDDYIQCEYSSDDTIYCEIDGNEITDFDFDADGDSISFAIDTDYLPKNDDNYLRIFADTGANAETDEDTDVTYDSAQLGAIWNAYAYDDLVGAWVYSDEAAFDAILIIEDGSSYVGAQQVLGDGGVVGGIEAGDYDLIADNTFSVADGDELTINSNGDDTVVGSTVTVNSDTTTATLTGDMDDGSITLSKIVRSDDHPEAGAWITIDSVGDDTGSDVYLVMDGNGNYMQTQLDYSSEGMVAGSGDDDCGYYNATEFGAYVVNDDGSYAFTPDSDTASEDTIAGDSNGCYGFDDVGIVEITVSPDGSTATLEGADGDDGSFTLDLERVE
jgi:hypothetical protein